MSDDVFFSTDGISKKLFAQQAIEPSDRNQELWTCSQTQTELLKLTSCDKIGCSSYLPGHHHFETCQERRVSEKHLFPVIEGVISEQKIMEKYWNSLGSLLRTHEKQQNWQRCKHEFLLQFHVVSTVHKETEKLQQRSNLSSTWKQKIANNIQWIKQQITTCHDDITRVLGAILRYLWQVWFASLLPLCSWRFWLDLKPRAGGTGPESEKKYRRAVKIIKHQKHSQIKIHVQFDLKSDNLILNKPFDELGCASAWKNQTWNQRWHYSFYTNGYQHHSTQKGREGEPVMEQRRLVCLETPWSEQLGLAVK